MVKCNLHGLVQDVWKKGDKPVEILSAPGKKTNE